MSRAAFLFAAVDYTHGAWRSAALPLILASITDREGLDSDLLAFVERALAAGIDWLQIREKDLSSQELFELCRAARALPNPRETKLFVNGRADIAVAASMDGVHLPSDAPSLAAFRRVVGPALQIGVSCHDLHELCTAKRDGADYAFYSPIFDTISKPGYGPPLGIEALAEACAITTIPVIALGGVTLDNASACVAAGAAGVAGISLFQRAGDLAGVARKLRSAE